MSLTTPVSAAASISRYITTTKYKLAFCELFNPYLHGEDSNSDKSVYSHYMVFEVIDNESFFNNDYKISLRYLLNLYKNMINTNSNPLNIGLTHPIVENYNNIIRKRNYYNIEIIETDILSGMEMVAYKKTFWLKILQRKWKKDYHKKINSYKNPRRLFMRQITGR